MKTIQIVYDDGSTDSFEFENLKCFPVQSKPVLQIICSEQKSSKARKAADPVHDEQILSEHEAGKTLDQLATDENVSKQSICKTLDRAKKARIAAATAPITVPTGPSSDNIRVAAHLLLGGPTPRKTIDELKQEIKKKL